jgi:ATP synthase F1 complex assembly factor 1
MTPHTAEQIGGIWNAYHTTHPTLANSYLSASLPAATYESMVSTARANPFFVLPLPRDSSDGGDAFEMFYMQWLFHAPPSPLPDANAASSSAPLPPITSVIFTTLAEFKANGEWAQPYLTLTHYSDLARSHESVLMRGEITAQTAQGPAGSPENPGFLRSRNQAHLLALALQRFYCANLVPLSERASDAADRATRAQALRDFREKPQEWDWQALVKMAYAGIA